MSSPRIAVIGSGIAGMASAWLLRRQASITLFEKDHYIGGHTNTLTIPTRDCEVAADTGFMVFNERNYPHLTGLFRLLGIESYPTPMSFSASLNQGAIEYAGTGFNTLFGQRRNLFRPAWYRMLNDILRFNRYAKALCEDDQYGDDIGHFLDRHRLGNDFRHQYLLPMTAAIWSCPAQTMMRFPARSMVRFLNNHGLLDLKNRPQWHTVKGGSQSYARRLMADMDDVRRSCAATKVERLEQGVRVHHQGGHDDFDQVIFASHADQTLALIDKPSDDERRLLSPFRYQENRVLVHSDPTLMPQRERVWASWNYLGSGDQRETQKVSVTYWMNNLQDLGEKAPNIFVTLNPLTEPDKSLVHAEIHYEHPVFDIEAMDAQTQLKQLQGRDRFWFCGSYFGYGFHEDGLLSAVNVAKALGAEIPWENE